MTTTRLRKAFQYLSDDDDDSTDNALEHMDEEEQEQIIARLKREDIKRNEQYKLIFLILPLASTTVFVPMVFMSQSLQAKLLGLLAISSLLCTAYLLKTGPQVSSGQSNHGEGIFQERYGPMQKYGTPLNAGLALSVALNAFTYYGKQDVHDSHWLLCLVPAVVLGVILIVKHVMLEVDITELEGLKYGYKGP